MIFAENTPELVQSRTIKVLVGGYAAIDPRQNFKKLDINLRTLGELAQVGDPVRHTNH